MVGTDLFRPRDVTQITVDADPAAALRSIQDVTDPLYRWEELDLATARARLEPALERCEQRRDPNLPEDAVVMLPVARSRMRRLPRVQAGLPEHPRPGPSVVTFDADDRRSAVSAFLSTSAADEAGEVGVVRFWAEVLAGYNTLVEGTPPTQVGPVRLSHIVLGYVPTMIEPSTRACVIGGGRSVLCGPWLAVSAGGWCVVHHLQSLWSGGATGDATGDATGVAGVLLRCHPSGLALRLPWLRLQGGATR